MQMKTENWANTWSIEPLSHFSSKVAEIWVSVLKGTVTVCTFQMIILNEFHLLSMMIFVVFKTKLVDHKLN